MKLKFKAKGQPQPDYQISGETINGIDLSVFPDDGEFTGDETTQMAGIYHVKCIAGELHVTLGQCGIAYQCQPINGSHDWQESDWIDSSHYNADTCYIIAPNKPDGAEYVKTDTGFTVALPQEDEPEEEDELV